MPDDSKQNSQKPYQVCDADLLATLLTVTSAHEQHESINHDFLFCLIYLFLPWLMTGYSIGVDRHSVNFGVTLAVNHDILVKKLKALGIFFLPQPGLGPEWFLVEYLSDLFWAELEIRTFLLSGTTKSQDGQPIF